jgi:hypothetical protein
MKSLPCSTIVVTISLMLASGAARGSADAFDAGEAPAVKIALTKFAVSDAALELSWRIRNDTDHDVWICDRLFTGIPSEVESIPGEDGKTVLLRRRFDLPRQGVTWEHEPRGYYVRLRPGQEKAESYSLPVPVPHYPVFGPLYAHGACADRLTLEIGYYDEDLSYLILAVVDVAEKLSCDDSASMQGWDSNARGLVDRFFPGWRIARVFANQSFAYFRDSVTSGSDEIVLPHMGQALRGEKVVRVTVDGVSIPYEGGASPGEGK